LPAMDNGQGGGWGSEKTQGKKKGRYVGREILKRKGHEKEG